MVLKHKFFVLSILVAWLAALAPGQTPEPLSGEEVALAQQINNVFHRAAEQVRPAVVSVRAHRNGGDSRMPDPIGLGSGVIIDSGGWVLTNNHVVEDTGEIEIILADGRRFVADDVRTDQDTDLAVVHIDTGGELPAAEFGDSDAVRPGEFVLAIGNPFGLDQTITAGIVSYSGRQTNIFGKWGYEDFIQTDAAINRGNSGGPLINLQGQIIGINDNILTPTGTSAGYGFAIPGNRARYVAGQLINAGKVERGYLGIQMANIEELRQLSSDELADVIRDGDVREKLAKAPDDLAGAFVTDVVEGSPAAEGGVEAGDIIIALDGESVASSTDLRNRIARMAPEQQVRLRVWREGERETLRVTLGDRTAARVREEEQARREPGLRPDLPFPFPFPDQDGPGMRPDSDGPKLGVEVRNLTGDLAREHGYPEDTEGVLIGYVQPGSLAERAGLREGHVILEVGGEKLTSIDRLRRIVGETDFDTEALELKVLTPDGVMTRVVKRGAD